MVFLPQLKTKIWCSIDASKVRNDVAFGHLFFWALRSVESSPQVQWHWRNPFPCGHQNIIIWRIKMHIFSVKVESSHINLFLVFSLLTCALACRVHTLTFLQAKVAVQTDAKRRMHEVQGTICSKASNVMLGVTVAHFPLKIDWSVLGVLKILKHVFEMGIGTAQVDPSSISKEAQQWLCDQSTGFQKLSYVCFTWKDVFLSIDWIETTSWCCTATKSVRVVQGMCWRCFWDIWYMLDSTIIGPDWMITVYHASSKMILRSLRYCFFYSMSMKSSRFCPTSQANDAVRKGDRVPEVSKLMSATPV